MDAVLFTPVALLIAISPGPNNVCALNHAMRYGVVAAVIGTTGRAVVYALFLFVSAIGLGAMLLASETAFLAIKWIGAAYLLYLGVRTWRSQEFNGVSLVDANDSPSVIAQPGMSRLMLQEFLVGISNPKAILLFAAVFPQFIKPDQPAAEQFLYLGATYLLAEYVASFLYAMFGVQIRRLVKTRRGAIRLNKVTGAFFAGAGALLLSTTHR
jgi:threonine/homoserine/homoserine lactone efflux protein